MKRRDWWLGVAVFALAVLLHAALPRYEWNAAWTVRTDRWTGTAEVGRFQPFGEWHGGRWVPYRVLDGYDTFQQK